jgi:DNA-directed RNA polymerase specialized sigma24 family protein
MTILHAVLLGAAPGYGAGIAALIAVRKASRRQAVIIDRLREEIHSQLWQQRLEYEETVAQVSQSVAFLEESAHQTEDALRNRLTPSMRAKTIQLLRSGLTPDKTASTLDVSRSEVRLIATIAKLCRL